MKRFLLAILFAALMVLAIPQIAHSGIVSASRVLTPASQAPSDEQLRVFAGTIVSKEGGKLFLQDDTDKTLYALDNQALAGKFAAKNVLVTGVLDKTGVIHVKNIEEQKA